MYVTICDVCGKETKERFRGKRLKVQKEEGGYGLDIFWRDIHVCEDCQENVLRAVKLLKGYYDLNMFKRVEIDGWRPISEYKGGWVLVRYIYETGRYGIPVVAIRDRDNSWVDNSANKVPGEVLEFFDFSKLPVGEFVVKKGWMV